jgi:uncharacterized secreted protein with C-terminal beta-propeller domain
MRLTRLAAALALLAAALLAPACKKTSPPALPPPAGIDPRPVLQPFTDCADLERTIEDTMVLQMKSALEQGRIGYFPGGGPIAMGDGGVPTAAPAAGAAGPASYSTTTTQVAGVGEADFVQNDGTRIAVLANGALHLARSWPPQALATASTTRIEGWAGALFLTGDKAVVFSGVYLPRALEGAHLWCPQPAAGQMAADVWCGFTYQNMVKVTTLDVADLDHPAVLSEVYLPGSYVSARLIGGRVRLVLSDSLPFPDGLTWWPDLTGVSTDEQRKAAFDALIAANEALIRARTLDDWLRRGVVKRPGQADVEVGYACGDFAHGQAPVRSGLLTVATYDVAGAALVSRSTIFGEPGVVYASADTLWVATPHWWWWPEAGQRDATYLHAFDLTDPDRAPYLGSGVVDGLPRDQYALDEHEGALRVATTVSERVASPEPWGRIETAGRISVLKQAGARFEVVGETPAFGAGERTFGARFLGPRGFVITARQVDPLFTFDLSDPAAPTKIGELEMPGFLSYLHPVDATHLLGLGQQVVGVGADRTTQVKVTLLDVGDLTAPRELDTELVGEGWAWSESIWDPKAFTWLASRGLAAIPVAGYDATSKFTSDLRLFKVDPAAVPAIAPAGRLSMSDVYLDDAGVPFSWWWSPYVRRSVLASDGSGDYVYAITDAGIRSADVSLLPAWLATVQFPPQIEPLPGPVVIQ